MNRQRILAAISGVAISVSLCAAITVSAGPVYDPTLEESFSSSVTYKTLQQEDWGDKREKTVTAMTRGYRGYHYVRAYLGGTSTDPSGAVADSKRRYSNGDVTATASQQAWVRLPAPYTLFFETAYAKYGK